MKKAILFLTLAGLTACKSKIELIGSLNMISNRNVTTKENYVQVKAYANSDNSDLRKTKAKTINEALQNCVKNSPGGEFLMNAKIYKVGEFYAVSGDIWGLAENQNYKGFKKGDRVQWRDNFTTYNGIITDLKNDKECEVKTESGKIRTASYDELKHAD